MRAGDEVSATDATYEGWAILELMGHRRLAGYVREVELAGAGMLRLDIPGDGPCDCATEPVAHIEGMEHQDGCASLANAATQFYSPSALYCLTPTTEAIARSIAESSRPRPAHQWELPVARPVEPAPEDDEEYEVVEDPAPPVPRVTGGYCTCGHDRDVHAAEHNGACLRVACECQSYDEDVPF